MVWHYEQMPSVSAQPTRIKKTWKTYSSSYLNHPPPTCKSLYGSSYRYMWPIPCLLDTQVSSYIFLVMFLIHFLINYYEHLYKIDVCHSMLCFDILVQRIGKVWDTWYITYTCMLNEMVWDTYFNFTLKIFNFEYWWHHTKTNVNYFKINV